MKKYYILLLITMILFRFSTFYRCSKEHDLYDEIPDKVCQCLEKENAVYSVGGRKCYDEILSEFADRLVKYHKLNSIGELNTKEHMDMMMGRLVKKCKFVVNLVKDSVAHYNPQFVPDINPVCDSVHLVEFY